MKLFISIFLTAVSINAFAQQATMPDPDWAEHQHVAERIAYWHSIEMSGTDTNIAEAKIRGYNQFVYIPRPISKGMTVQSATAWEQVGGAQGVANIGTNTVSVGTVSGRPTCIAFDPISTQVFYLGTSGGGLWKTEDLGNTFTSLSDSWSSYAMGGVAVDQTDRNTVYAATGDMYDQPGDGLYKSVDGGLNWTHPATGSDIGTQCNQVLIDPQVHSTIYVTGTSGVYRSLDAGATWTHILSIGGVTSMAIDPTNGQNLYAGGGGVIKKSTDGGNTWSQNDLASNISGKNTVTLAISKASPTTIYASIGSSNTGGAIGLARSDNGGASWSLHSQDNYMGQQEFYDNACAVNPGNASQVVVGGLDIYSSSNKGASLNQLTVWNETSDVSNFTHADIHVLTFNPTGSTLYALTDGGIFSSTTGGTSWQQTKNNTLATLLFVGGDAAPDFSYVLGGAQDNGVNHAPQGATAFQQTQGGDGGRCFISQEDGTGSTAYSTYVYAVLYKSSSGGSYQSWSGNILDGAGPDGPYLENNDGTPFYMMYDVCETDASKVAICGNTNIYYSTDGVNTLTNLSSTANISAGSPSPKSPKAVHVAGSDPNVVYVGTGGYVYVTKNAEDLTGVTWVKSTKSIGTVSGFVTDPNDASKAWASISGFGGGKTRFYLTTDYGKTWTNPATNLPDLDARTIARAPNGNLFIGTTFGVLYSKDNGFTWGTLRDGIPLCQITKLRVRGSNSQWLLATTYGRGMYRIDVSDLPPVAPVNSVSFSPASSPDMPAITAITPNPIQANGNAVIGFTLHKEGSTSLILYNEGGIEVKTLLKAYLQPGDQTSQVEVSGLASGVYFAVLTSNGYAVTQRLVITK